MKKISYTANALMIALLLCSYAFAPYADHSAATVKQTSGMYIFVNCTPQAEYTFLETMKCGVTMSGKPDQIFNSVIKKAKKDHPDADGLIFQDMSLEKADVIKFK